MIQAAEFFAGHGPYAKTGLESAGIGTAFANDIDDTKATIYRDNWGADELDVNDIRALTGNDIPNVDLATASFPCVDLSLAGHRRGLEGEQSGLVLDFLRILGEMDDRIPLTVMIENVPGFLTANDGKDWQTVVSGLNSPVMKSLSDQSVSGATMMTSIAGLPSMFATMAIARAVSN